MDEAVLNDVLDLDTTTRKVGMKNKALATLCEGLKRNAKELAESVASYKRRNNSQAAYLDEHDPICDALVAKLREQTERQRAAHDRLEALHR